MGTTTTTTTTPTTTTTTTPTTTTTTTLPVTTTKGNAVVEMDQPRPRLQLETEMNLAERFQPKDKSVLKPVLIGAGALTGLAAIAAAAMLAKKRKIEPGKKKVDVKMTPPEKKPKKSENTPNFIDSCTSTTPAYAK